MKTPRQLLLLATIAAGCAAAPAPAGISALGTALVFHASFDQDRADADLAAGDPRIFTAAARNRRAEAAAGLPNASTHVRLVREAGRFGGALEFRQKMTEQVFFRGPENLGFRANDWSGTLSFWLRVSPDHDLPPGYCDPVQVVAQEWTKGNFFVEFSKDHSPRHFRFAIMAVTKFWNPQNRKWEEMPEPERPMVAVHQPPFRGDRWTHVLVTFAHINSGEKNGRGTLYLDGRKIGSFAGWNNTFEWDPAQSALTLGLNYVGFIDDLAVFNRELTDAEAMAVFGLAHGVRDLRRP